MTWTCTETNGRLATPHSNIPSPGDSDLAFRFTQDSARLRPGLSSHALRASLVTTILFK